MHGAEGVVAIRGEQPYHAVLVFSESVVAEEGVEQGADHRHRHARVGELPAHDHHEHEPEEQKDQAGNPVLDPDDLVISRDDVFLPEAELVMIVVAVLVVVVVSVGSERCCHTER